MVRQGTLAAAFPQESDELAPRSSRPLDHLLREHMIREHGRTARETDGLPLERLHRFEHVEQAMGLTDLRHHHAAAPNRQ